jgi:hypothetical protein
LAKFLEEREGPRSIALEVPSADAIRDALHAAGIEGSEPTKGKWESSSPVTKEWLTIDPKPALPGNIFFNRLSESKPVTSQHGNWNQVRVGDGEHRPPSGWDGSGR